MMKIMTWSFISLIFRVLFLILFLQFFSSSSLWWLYLLKDIFIFVRYFLAKFWVLALLYFTIFIK